MTVNDASLNESGSKLSKVAATSLLMGVTRGSSEAYGLTMCAYNKGNEIDKASGKEYIREFYGNPKMLHRLEVHLNNQEIKDYCRNVVNVVQDIELLSDQDFLDAMYDYHLSSLLRFTRGRKKLDWNEILCTGRV